ncbi:hypothetical protein BGX31_000483, partial [Mortierella sp. GBA43]
RTPRLKPSLRVPRTMALNRIQALQQHPPFKMLARRTTTTTVMMMMRVNSAWNHIQPMAPVGY